MDLTTDQIVRSLAGMTLVKNANDPLEAQLPNDYGLNDFPIIIQEKGFLIDSIANIAVAIKAGEKRGNGKQTFVNGVVGGYLRIPPEMVRLRILNVGLSTQLKISHVEWSLWNTHLAKSVKHRRSACNRKIII